jgi:hypothetical protein
MPRLPTSLTTCSTIHGQGDGPSLEWALASQAAVRLDDQVCPLATTELAVYEQLAVPAPRRRGLAPT